MESTKRTKKIINETVLLKTIAKGKWAKCFEDLYKSAHEKKKNNWNIREQVKNTIQKLKEKKLRTRTKSIMNGLNLSEQRWFKKYETIQQNFEKEKISWRMETNFTGLQKIKLSK